MLLTNVLGLFVELNGIIAWEKIWRFNLIVTEFVVLAGVYHNYTYII